jgi:hypothetical protein
MKMEETECSETAAYKFQTPGNYPKESIQHTEQGESLKSRFLTLNLPYNFSQQNDNCIARVIGTRLQMALT